MKNLRLLLPVLMLVACATTPSQVPVQNSYVSATIERVLVRTEAYMEAPTVDIDEGIKSQVEAAVMVARTMTAMPEASGDVLLVTMSPIMSLHDVMVTADPDLDPLERDIYLEDTIRLRSLFNSVSIHASLSVPVN